MLKKLLHILTRNDKIETKKKNHKNLVYLNYICKLLEIDFPSIISVACLYEYNSQIIGILKFCIEDIPKDANFIAAYYNDEENKIYIAEKLAGINNKTKELCFRDICKAEEACILAHELRHIWQKKYHSDIYYKYNAVGLEIIEDIAEIDADAFAISYIFSDRTPFSYKDMPEWTEELVFQATADGGKRWARVRELSGKYEFENTDKIEVAKQSADYERINQLVGEWKINKVLLEHGIMLN